MTSRLTWPAPNQRQLSSSGSETHSLSSDWVSRSSAALVVARQPSQGRRLLMWLADRRAPLSVEMPAPNTSLCSLASLTWAMTGAASGVPFSVSSVRNTVS